MDVNSTQQAGHGPALQGQILSTLRFFDLQDIPLTLLELHKFLVNDTVQIKQNIDIEFEVIQHPRPASPLKEEKENNSVDQILSALEKELKGRVETKNGYYCLPGRVKIIDSRLNNYLFGFKREKRAKKYLWLLKYVPFVRGVAIGGSQALGQQRAGSDIDLLIITDPKFMWLARTLVSAYFQIFGVRRYKQKTQNRFCLNHYLGRPKALDREKNLYKAMEYLRLRPVVYPRVIAEFQNNNLDWIKIFLPNARAVSAGLEKPAGLQRVLEKLFTNKFGAWLENLLKNLETRRIRQDKYTFITGDELSFHPESRHNVLLESFFGQT